MNSIGYLLIPVLIATAAVLQARFMGTLDQTMGTAENVFITYGGGGLLAALFMLYLRGGNLTSWVNVPWYAFLAGVMGLIIVTGIGFTVPRLGFVTTFTLITVTQFTLAALFDHYGLLGSDIRPINGGRFVGIVVLLIGSWLVLR